MHMIVPAMKNQDPPHEQVVQVSMSALQVLTSARAPKQLFVSTLLFLQAGNMLSSLPRETLEHMHKVMRERNASIHVTDSLRQLLDCLGPFCPRRVAWGCVRPATPLQSRCA